MLSFRLYEKDDQPFFEKLIQDSVAWQEEECSVSGLASYMQKYEMMNGKWTLWSKGEKPLGISFTVDWVPSNEKPWIGTILMDGRARRKGYGRQIVDQIAERYKKQGHDVLFTSVPLHRIDWMQFLAMCGFEQFKVEENERNKRYMVMARPL